MAQTGTGVEELLTLPSPRAETDQPASGDDSGACWDAVLDDVCAALHDGPAQALLAARMVLDLQARRDPALAAVADPVRQALTEALLSVRTAMGQTRARNDPSDLATTLKVLVDQARAAGHAVEGAGVENADIENADIENADIESSDAEPPAVAAAAGRVAHRLVQAMLAAAEPGRVSLSWQLSVDQVLLDVQLPCYSSSAAVRAWEAAASHAGVNLRTVALSPEWLRVRLFLPTMRVNDHPSQDPLGEESS